MAWESAFSQHMLDLALSEEDVEELRSERSIKHTTVTCEDIEALSVDEELTSYQRLLHILTSGRDVQQVHALEHMYNTIKEESKENMEKALLVFKEMFFASSTTRDVQIAGANFLQQVCANKLVNGEKFAALFSRDLLKHVREREEDTTEEWLSAMISSFGMIPNRYINEVVAFLKSNGTLSQPMPVRLLCAKLVAHVSKYVDKKRLTSEMIPVIRSLCQDIDLDVRACMCAQLLVCSTFLADEHITGVLIPELTLLMEDEEASVRLVALETLSKTMYTVPSHVVTSSSLSALTARFYNKVLEKGVGCELIGSACCIGEISVCAHLLDHNDVVSILNAYTRLCTQGLQDTTLTTTTEKFDGNLEGGATVGANGMDTGAECRYWCAYNFPAVFISTQHIKDDSVDLVAVFQSLVRDAHPTVRKPLACSLHEIAKILIEDHVEIVYSVFVTLLSDTDLDILYGVLQGFPSTLRLLAAKCPPFISNILPVLLTCEQCIASSLRWRVHVTFLESISNLCEFLPWEEFHLRLVPLLRGIVVAGNKVYPVRVAAGKTLLCYMKHIRSVEERNEMCTFLEEELAHSNSKTARILYLDICHFVVEHFSKCYFKEKFYAGAMELACDSVVNVRLKFCATLPLLKSQIRLPCDRLLLQTLEQTVRRIMAMDNDRDVSDAIRVAIADMDNVRVSMDGTRQTDDDREDHQREEDEEALFEEYQQHKKTESSNKLTGKDRQRSNSIVGVGSRKSVHLHEDSSHNLSSHSHGSGGSGSDKKRPSKVGSNTKITKKTSKLTKEGQSSGKVTSKPSNAKLHHGTKR